MPTPSIARILSVAARTARAGLSLVGLPLVAAAQSPEARLDVGSPPGAANSDTVRVAAAGQTVCAVWRDQRNGSLSDIYFNRSSDGGETWQPQDTRLDGGSPGGTSSTEPRLCMSGDVVHVVWRELASPGHDVAYRVSRDRGQTFGPIVRLDLGDAPGASDSLDIEIACEGALVYVVWADTRNSTSFVCDIFGNRSADAGATWLPAAQRLDLGDAPGAGNSLRPTVAIANGVVHVAWEDRRGTTAFGPDIHYTGSHDGGATWPAGDVRLDRGSPAAAAPSAHVRLAADGSLVCAVWQDQRDGAADIYANLSTDGGLTWRPTDLRLDTNSPAGASVSQDPRVAVVGPMIHVVWLDTAIPGVVQADVLYNRSLDTGTTWLATPARLDDATGAGATSSRDVALATTGATVVVAWSEAAQGAHDIYVDRSLDAGTTWLPGERRVDRGDAAGASESRATALAVGDGTAHAVWLDRRSSAARGDVYHASLLGFRSHGAGTAGTGGLVPTLQGRGQASIGELAHVDLAAARGGAVAVLLLSITGRATIPFAGGTLHLAAPWFDLWTVLGGTAGGAGAGVFTLSAIVPGSPSLLGTALQFQGAVLDPQAAAGFALTPGLEAWIL